VYLYHDLPSACGTTHTIGESMRIISTGLLMTFIAGTAFAQINRIDVIRPDAPELAHFGVHTIGVQTLVLTDTDRPDILKTVAGEATQFYDRSLTVEVWYPAQLAADQQPGGQYQTITRDPTVTAVLHGSAVRDAAPLSALGAFPLVIISHGYPGNRYLMSHLGENLASKGYVAVSIDHRDSTYDDQQAFASTLYNRSFDQAFVLAAVAVLGAAGSDSFLSGLVDANNTALIGYSMGGYGVVNNLGAGYSETGITALGAPPNRLLEVRGAANPDFKASLDPRIKAGVAIGPWGMNNRAWDAGGLAGLDKPALFIAGGADTTSGYENGIRAIYEHAINSDRYLLTFENAGHNAGAPIPLPVELAAAGNAGAANHYLDPVWDNVRMNNILDHFVTAFLDLHLKGEADKRSYLDLIPHAQDGVYDVDASGQPRATHTYWKGFPQRSGIGLVMEKGERADQ